MTRSRTLGGLAIVLAAAGLPALVPTASGATDLPVRPAARTAAEVSGPGSWSLEPDGAGSTRVTWTAPQRLPIGADRPEILLDGVPAGVTTVAADGRTVVTTVGGATPSVSDLDVQLSGVLLDEPRRDPGEASSPAVQPSGDLLPDDPAQPGPYPVRSSDYQLPGVKLPGMRQPIEMVGHVVTPEDQASTGPRPLVLFLHGRHTYCYVPGDPDDFGSGTWPCAGKEREIPSQLGYDYLQKRLASQGYATVSVRVNGINAQDDALMDGGADARARIVQAHLAHWAAAPPDPQVDLDRVVLVGHSRGGEGVNRASLRIGLDAPYRIVGQVLLAPTDFGSQTAPFVPTVTVLPSCDGDVSDLQGQRFTDVSRRLVSGDTSLKSSLLVVGANHNWFNTEWTTGLSQAPSFDDWGGDKDKACGTRDPNRLTKAEQRDVALGYVTGAVHLFASAEQQYLPLFDGSAVRVASAGDAVVRSHALGGGRRVLRPGHELKVGTGTAKVSVCTGMVGSRTSDCGFEAGPGPTPHWRPRGVWGARAQQGLDLRWSAVGQTARLDLATPVDLTGRRLDLRTVVDQWLGHVQLGAELVDATGARAPVTLVRGGRVDRLPGGKRVGAWWAQDLVLDPAGVTGVDLTRVTAVRLTGRTASGRVVVLDAALTAPGLASVPQRRAPLLDVGAVRRPEGNSKRPVTLQVPMQVRGTVTEPVRVRYFLATGERRPATGVVTVPAGATSASFPITYQPDRSYGMGRQLYVEAYAEGGGSTGSWTGSVDLVEDDPAPRFTVERVRKRVVEGRNATVRLKLSQPVTDEAYVAVRFVRAGAPRATAGDLPGSVFDVPQRPGTALHRTQQWFWVQVPAGRQQVTFRLPTRRDGTREPAEHLALKFRFELDRGPTVRTVRFVLADR